MAAMQMTVAGHLGAGYQPDARSFGTRWCPAERSGMEEKKEEIS